MKKFSTLFCTFLIVMCSYFSIAQNPTFSLLSKSSNELIIEVQFPAFETATVRVNGNPMNILLMQGAYPIEEKGAPDLLKSVKSIIIPENSNPTLQVLDAQFSVVNNFELAPSKGSISREIDPSTIPYEKGKQYLQDQFFCDNQGILSAPYQLRDFHGTAIDFFPFAYNPVQKTLKVYQTIIVKVTFDKPLNNITAKKNTREYNEIYKRHFLNYDLGKYNPISEEGEMLIIAHDAFMADMQPFVDWKNQSGTKTTMVGITSVGNSQTAIKTYIQNFYNANNLSYVLLVGDHTQVAPYNSSSSKENMYVELVGGDSYPDAMLGRMSAENVTHVQTQVKKSIDYEKAPPVTTHFNKFGGVASQEGPGYLGRYDHQHIRILGDRLKAYTYDNVNYYEFFEGTQGGTDAPGNPTPTQISAAINSGLGVMNYCGHGDVTLWVTSGYNNTNVNALTNDNKLPFIFSVACVNGQFVGQTCFAETWLRATNNSNGEPTGAVAFLGSTINQPWIPPMIGQEEMNLVMTEAFSSNIKRTFGGISFSGYLKMIESGSGNIETYRTWVLFGDPSITVRTKAPETMAITHENIIMGGATQFVVNSAKNGARATLSVENEMIATGIIVGGTVTLTFPEIEVGTIVKLVVTNYNHDTYLAELEVIAMNQSYFKLDEYQLKDEAGVSINQLHNELTAKLSITVKNLGLQPSTNPIFTITTDDPNIEITNGSATLGTIAANETVIIDNAFTFKIADDYIYNVEEVEFVLEISDSYGTQTFKIFEHIAAPAPKIVNYQITSDAANGHLQPGCSGKIEVTLQNVGDYKFSPSTCSISTTAGRLTFNACLVDVAELNANETVTKEFTYTIASDIVPPRLQEINLLFETEYYFDHLLVSAKIGPDVEDFESGKLEDFDWINSEINPWEFHSYLPYEGFYCLRSGTIQHSQTSEIAINWDPGYANDSISFYVFTACQNGAGTAKDRLEFYIGEELMGWWDGETNWNRVAFAVPQGEHLYKWIYVKDATMSSSFDYVRIDYIVFPATLNTVTIKETEATKIQLYPNPVKDELIINNYELKITKIEIYDISGKRLSTINSQLSTINVAHLQAGVYFISLTTENGIVTKKFVKM